MNAEQIALSILASIALLVFLGIWASRDKRKGL